MNPDHYLTLSGRRYSRRTGPDPKPEHSARVRRVVTDDDGTTTVLPVPRPRRDPRPTARPSSAPPQTSPPRAFLHDDTPDGAVSVEWVRYLSDDALLATVDHPDRHPAIRAEALAILTERTA